MREEDEKSLLHDSRRQPKTPSNELQMLQ